MIFSLPVSKLLATVFTLVAGRGLFFRPAFYLQDLRVISLRDFANHFSLHCFLRCLFCFFFPPSITFLALWRLENECWDSCGLKGHGSERVDTWEGRKGLVSTAFKNGGGCRVMKLEPLCFSLPISSHMASQSLKTRKNNHLMRWVNVWLFLSAPSIKQPLCNSFYSLRTSSGGVTSTLVLHRYPLDLIKIRFQGEILGINWLRVRCKCLSNRKSFPCLHSLSVYIRLCKHMHRKKVFYCFYKITLPRKKTLCYGPD